MYINRELKKRKRIRTHGFRERMATAEGRNTIARRRLVGRKRIAVTLTSKTGKY